MIDSLQGNARLLCVMDHAGNVLLGKPPIPDPPVHGLALPLPAALKRETTTENTP